MILDDFGLTDQVAIVSGAGVGIGRAIAVAFAEAGADVVVAARTRSDLDETVRQIEQTGRRGLGVPTDVMVEDELSTLVDAAVERFGRVSILVNNAGGTQPRASMQTSAKYLSTALHFNAVAPFLLSMTQNMAADLAPSVRVNAIGVGGVATQSMEFVMSNDELRSQHEANTPMRRVGQPRDVAAAALYLASPASSWVTGVVLRVDGGTTRPSFDLPAPPLRPSAQTVT